MDQQPEKQVRGRSKKQPKSPRPDLYTFTEALNKLGIPKSTFIYAVDQGKIPKVVPPGKTYGYYPKKFIDDLATATHLFVLQYVTEPTEFGVATGEDIPGMYDVIASLWGKNVTTPIETRVGWYQKNPLMDYVVKQNGIVTGYFSMMPLKPEPLEAMMAGKMRGWQITPDHLYVFKPGQIYDLYVGMAVRGDIPYQERYGRRLIAGVIRVFEDFARREILFRRLFATSDRSDGIKLCSDLGFIQAQGKETDLFGRFVLDLETSQAPFAQRYQAVAQQVQQEKAFRK